MNRKLRILILDDNIEFAKSLRRILSKDFDIQLAHTAEEAKASLYDGFDLALLDIRLQEDDADNREGLAVLKWVHENLPNISVIMMTAYDEIDLAIEAMQYGAIDFFRKTRIDIKELHPKINKAIERTRLLRKVNALETETTKIYDEIIGEDSKIKDIKRLLHTIGADGEITVLIRGETGTGKELVARAIHRYGVRNDRPFVAVSLPSLNKETIVSDLFGHEPGAFTGAINRRIGFIEEADKGVLFLDEIGELSNDVQTKLLRTLETKEITRLGSNKKISIDFQLLAATNRNLEEDVKNGTFRKDLYFRLKAVEILLPTLSQRPGDIPILTRYFLDRLREHGRTTIKRISREAIEALKSYDWPGNVRELKQCIERAVLYSRLGKDDIVSIKHLPRVVREGNNLFYTPSEIKIPENGIDVFHEIARLELSYIQAALKQTNGKKTEAWKLLNFSNRHTFRRHIESHFTSYPDLKNKFPYLEELYE